MDNSMSLNDPTGLQGGSPCGPMQYGISGCNTSGNLPSLANFWASWDASDLLENPIPVRQYGCFGDCGYYVVGYIYGVDYIYGGGSTAANNAQTPQPPKTPDPNNYHCSLLSSSADIGVCTFTCVPPDGMGGDIARIPVYVIQKACNTTNRSCPIALDVYPPSHWGPFEFGRPKVVPNSCVYGKVQ